MTLHNLPHPQRRSTLNPLTVLIALQLFVLLELAWWWAVVTLIGEIT